MSQGPWRTLRCVVEVKVPQNNRSGVKDLIYHVEKALFQHGKFPGMLPMPRSHHPERHDAKPRVKDFSRVVQAQTIKADRPGPQSNFEQLVIRALYAIISFTATRGGRRAISMWITDAKQFLTED